MLTDRQRRQHIIDLGYHVILPWSRVHPDKEHTMDAYDEMAFWCDNQFGAEGFAWTSVYDYEVEATKYWFVCEDFAFEFKMRFR